MTENDDSPSPNLRWAPAVLALAAVGGLALWLTRAPDPMPAERSAEPQIETADPSSPAAPAHEPAADTGAATVGAPRVVLPDQGRLTVKLDDLREGDVLAFGLTMPDEARGDGRLATKVVDVTREQVVEVETAAIDGDGTGVRVEVDPAWLQPGQYMIQVETQQSSHIPLRRYVLIVE